MEKDIGRVRGKITEIVDRQFFQGRPQGCSVKMVGCKTVRLILIVPGETVHGQPHNGGQRRVEKSKTDQGQMEAVDIGAECCREQRVGGSPASCQCLLEAEHLVAAERGGHELGPAGDGRFPHP